MRIGNIMTNLKFHRLNSGLTQLAVEHKLQVSNCWLSLLENGHRKPTPKLLKSLAELYGVGVGDLRGDFIFNAEAVA